MDKLSDKNDEKTTEKTKLEECSPSAASAKIIDLTKKSGQFDKYRHELTNDIVNSTEMQRLIEKCGGIIEEKLSFASDASLQAPEAITQLREQVRAEIKRRRMVDNTMDRVLNQYMRRLHPVLASRMEEMVRAELGMPPPPKEMKRERQDQEDQLPDDNLELIDMEVSSGGPSSISNSPSSTSPERPSSSTNNSRKRRSSSPDEWKQRRQHSPR